MTRAAAHTERLARNGLQTLSADCGCNSVKGMKSREQTFRNWLSYLLASSIPMRHELLQVNRANRRPFRRVGDHQFGLLRDRQEESELACYESDAAVRNVATATSRVRVGGKHKVAGLQPGTHIITPRFCYTHHGIYAGDGRWSSTVAGCSVFADAQ